MQGYLPAQVPSPSPLDDDDLGFFLEVEINLFLCPEVTLAANNLKVRNLIDSHDELSLVPLVHFFKALVNLYPAVADLVGPVKLRGVQGCQIFVVNSVPDVMVLLSFKLFSEYLSFLLND